MSLTDEQKQTLAKQLRDRETELYADIQREKAQRPDFTQMADQPDPGEQSVADLLVDLNHADVGRDLTELRAVAAAQQRMASGDYGSCIDCGKDIPYERLRVHPEALRCLGCQENFERHHAGAGRGATL